MPTYRNIGGVNRLAIPWRKIGGTWKQCVLWRNIAGVWKLVGGQLLVTASPSSLYASSFSSPVSAGTTATASQGSGSYTYAWSLVIGVGVTVTGGNTATPTFSAIMPSGQQRAATYRCTATDTVTGLTATVDVDIILERI